MQYWLFKTEPEDFSITDLENRPGKREPWDGVRNYQARNFLRDKIQIGDQVLIYHSSCKLVGVAGIAKVTDNKLVDSTQFNPESKYYDPKSTPDNPRWWMVEIEHVKTFEKVFPLKAIKEMEGITELPLVKKGHRLSVMPVIEDEYLLIVNKAAAY